MRTVALLRHGKSSWAQPDLADFDRPLKKRGREASIAIGEELRRRGLAFDLVLASPAERVVQTLKNVEKGFGRPLRPSFDEDIYGASSRGLVKILRQTADSAERLLLVGHNPGLQELALALAADNEPLRSALAEHFPTAALVLIDMPAASWKKLQPGTGRVIDYLKPREIAR